MVRRSMSDNNHIINVGADPRNQEYIHPEPCVLYGSFTSFPHPNVHTVIPAAGNIGNFYLHHLPNHQEGAVIYGMPPSNGVQQPHPATNVAVFATSSNHYNPYVAAPSTDFLVPVNHGLHNSWAWNQAAPSPYLPGGAGGYVDAGFMAVQGYQVTASNGGLNSFLHAPPNMQYMGGHTMSFSPQMTASSRVYLQNSSSNNSNNLLRGVVPFSPTGSRLYRPHPREFMPEANTRHHNLPNMRVLPENRVAMLDVPAYHEVGNVVDQFRDMRLDINHMSYEELLALGEHIGNVTTGLSEEAIVTNLKTRIFLSTETPCALESVACQDHKTDCVICQTGYIDQDKIGVLECGHEHHEDCIKKWLVVKNICPICKSTALSTKKQVDGRSMNN
ncbi:probable E3 ubiquitin-protein ligase ZFP1 isoform X2 [Lycium ferocissimum]|uniref:probable E3 ubiquitin-protein ligase ZFP1 isoform X2 n=1 Tax=Lycium ferocissimum TaxID=112874 RepID=UPI0028155EC8|nr:probable E3 ubiquitin-protein ligase ZFP1 isoform X2 [Lycium ferocissimum]XP_059283513.1 probable E3 ubiquitin-protein ligase ZFP1 isoform X2 [Lycium ferocissimum]XP_059283514.1 probable E3 ubiquitin-protein ligase ZFP1 isoform X2 [Lycium ferocissimum]XP_059283515.1 probable E3 ubiquitin-protein ligase ZFP1 isoform X2 [Lycium ferocissimum]XP_059283516.1 probable E3 ubiquitin-protein ligase ZFP1 isoform X2 [Lycium ferocissimum]XP_059283517.1 probable E3 ubiquitin-protein ligase ZFP1 isoform 